MAKSKKKTDSKSILQKVIEKDQQKSPSRYDYNKVVFEWEANDRPVLYFSNGQKISFAGFIVFLGLYFFWVGQPILTLVAAAVFFVMFVFITVPPQRVKHQIENVGIRTMGQLYSWEDMTEFWMAEKDGSMILYIDTRLNFPARLIFMIENFQDAVTIVKLLSQKRKYKHLTTSQSGMERFLEGKYVDPIVFFGEDLIEIYEKGLEEEEKEKVLKQKSK